MKGVLTAISCCGETAKTTDNLQANGMVGFLDLIKMHCTQWMEIINSFRTKSDSYFNSVLSAYVPECHCALYLPYMCPICAPSVPLIIIIINARILVFFPLCHTTLSPSPPSYLHPADIKQMGPPLCAVVLLKVPSWLTGSFSLPLLPLCLL